MDRSPAYQANLSVNTILQQLGCFGHWWRSWYISHICCTILWFPKLVSQVIPYYLKFIYLYDINVFLFVSSVLVSPSHESPQWISNSRGHKSSNRFPFPPKYEHPGEHLGRCLCNEAGPNNVCSKDQEKSHQAKHKARCIYLICIVMYVYIYIHIHACFFDSWLMTINLYIWKPVCVCVSRILRYQPSKKIVFCVNQNKGHWGSRCKYMKCCGKKVWRWGAEIMQKRWSVWPAWQ